MRCPWCEKDELYRNYHDQEWGKPLYEDQKFFEFLLLECFQAGLSWYTILKKRENFREALDDFDVEKVANYTPKKESELMQNEGIIRNRLKINAAIINAIKFQEIQQEFGSFSTFIWSFVENSPLNNSPESLAEVPARTELSDQISKILKKRGFKFVGSTVIYAFLQATGLINDHLVSCEYK